MPRLRSVCVYCGSRLGKDQAYREAAQALGQGLAARGLELVYGGGRIGLMGLLADATLAAGGQVTGVIPRDLEDREVGHTNVSNLLIVENMHDRKMTMARRADAFVVLPGGLGTLDETFEIVTWRQLGFHDKPVIVADIGGYWNPLRQMIDAIVRHEFAKREDRGLVAWASDIPGVFAALEGAPAPAVPLDTRPL